MGSINFKNEQGQWVKIQALKGQDGATGKSIEYVWRGTELGIRQQGQTDYTYVNLKGQTGNTGATGSQGIPGIAGTNGKEVELRKTDTHIEWRLVGASSWNTLVALTDIKGQKGDTGSAGKSIEYNWRNTELGIRQQGESNYTYVNLKGQTGNTGSQGATGKTPNITIGTVSTLNPGQNATITKTGTTDNPVFNFGIPKGEKGDGATGGGSGKELVANYTLNNCVTIPITDINMSTGVFTTTTNVFSYDGHDINLVLKGKATMDLNKTFEEFCNYNNWLTLQKTSNTTFKINSKSSYKPNSKLDITAFEFQVPSHITISSITHTKDCTYKVRIIGTKGKKSSACIKFNTNKGSLTLNVLDGRPIQYVDIECEFTIVNGLITGKCIGNYKHNRIGSPTVGWDLGTVNKIEMIQFDISSPLTITDLKVDGSFNNGTKVVVWRE